MGIHLSTIHDQVVIWKIDLVVLFEVMYFEFWRNHKINDQSSSECIQIVTITFFNYPYSFFKILKSLSRSSVTRFSDWRLHTACRVHSLRYHCSLRMTKRKTSNILRLINSVMVPYTCSQGFFISFLFTKACKTIKISPIFSFNLLTLCFRAFCFSANLSMTCE